MNFHDKTAGRAALALAVLALLTAGLAGPASAGKWDNETDPMVIAKAAADYELFGRIVTDDRVRPDFEVHHDTLWEDATLMAGVFGLYDRLEEQGRPAERYLDYLEAYGERKLGTGLPVVHGDQICVGQTYIWLYERSGRTSDHLRKTNPLLPFLGWYDFKPNQKGTGYNDYWMRFWQDDIHMVTPFLAMRGRAAGSKGMPGGKDGRELAMIYCRAYHDVLGDPATGLYWHNPKAVGDYHWGRGNGWVAAGFYKVMKILEEDPAYADDAEWLRERLAEMMATLKDNRNEVGTWCPDIGNCEEYGQPETSGSAFFTYVMASMIADGYLGDEYVPVVQKAWNFLRLSVGDDGFLMRVQPVGRGPIKDDFENKTETYGIGAFLLAATAMSRLPEDVVENAGQAECVHFKSENLKNRTGEFSIFLDLVQEKDPGFPADFKSVQLVVGGKPMPETLFDKEAKAIYSKGLGSRGPGDDVYLFYVP